MKQILVILALVVLHVSGEAQRYQKIHRKAIVVDTHNDVLSEVILEGMHLEDDLTGKAHTDFMRLQQGGVDVEVFSIWCDSSYGKGTGFNMANRQIDSLYAIAARNRSKMSIVRTPAELYSAVRAKKLAAMIGVEGGHMIEDRIDYLDSLYKRGARYLTLTWSNSTSWATSSLDESINHIVNAKRGLDDFGIEVVKHMNQLGMMVDVSHLGEQSFYDVMKYTTKPVIASHSSVYAIAPHQRNLKDEQIKAIAKNGGVIQINFNSDFLDSSFEGRRRAYLSAHRAEIDSLRKAGFRRASGFLKEKYPQESYDLSPPLSQVLDHIDYIVRLVGVDYVGLGSDFDGITSSPKDLQDVSQFPNITRGLLLRGYSKKDILKILGGNFLRVFQANSF